MIYVEFVYPDQVELGYLGNYHSHLIKLSAYADDSDLLIPDFSEITLQSYFLFEAGP